MDFYDVIVVGGGQSGLAVAYYLRRTGLSYLILDREDKPGGSWQHFWHSLRLFSPAQWSSLPGVMMPGGGNYYPTRDETIHYLKSYESRYKFPIKRSVVVESVSNENDLFSLVTSSGVYQSKVVVSATGSFRSPFIPHIPGREMFNGKILHSSDYKSPDEFNGQRVAVAGEGNSGAQILAEVSRVAETIWITKTPPRFLPDHIDGRSLFDAATRMYEAKKAGKTYKPPSLGDIVMVPPVKEAKQRGVFSHWPPFDRFSKKSIVWADGHEERVDSVIFCTGFQPALDHLKNLGISVTSRKVSTEETKSRDIKGLWFVGYGNWTGFASATLIGVGRSARNTVEEIKGYLPAK